LNTSSSWKCSSINVLSLPFFGSLSTKTMASFIMSAAE
jgi:hypothetical protein